MAENYIQSKLKDCMEFHNSDYEGYSLKLCFLLLKIHFPYQHLFKTILCQNPTYNGGVTNIRVENWTIPHTIGVTFAATALHASKMATEKPWTVKSCWWILNSEFSCLPLKYYTLFFIRTSKFWPSLIFLNFLGNFSLNCSFKNTQKKLFLFLKVHIRTTTARNNS